MRPKTVRSAQCPPSSRVFSRRNQKMLYGHMVVKKVKHGTIFSSQVAIVKSTASLAPLSKLKCAPSASFQDLLTVSLWITQIAARLKTPSRSNSTPILRPRPEYSRPLQLIRLKTRADRIKGCSRLLSICRGAAQTFWVAELLVIRGLPLSKSNRK